MVTAALMAPGPAASQAEDAGGPPLDSINATPLLPWVAGSTWNVLRGPTGGHSARSWDFQPPGAGSHNNLVLAVASGTARRIAACSDGQAIVELNVGGDVYKYVHLEASSVADAGIGPNGTTVSRGQVLGRLHPNPPSTDSGCGYTSPAGASHLHLQLPYLPITIDGTRFSNSAPLSGSLTSSNALHNPPGDDNPIGSYDGASNPEHGRVRVFGWAFDPNQRTTPVDIHVYVGGHAGDLGVEGHDLGPADRRRSDLNDIYPGIGDYHGFDETFTTSKEGNQAVCVYAINRGPGTNQFLGCKSVDIRDPDPFGSVDSVASPLGGHVRVGGWAIDPNARTTPVEIHAYVGGRAGEPGAEFHSLGPADLYRPDIEDAYPRSGPYHGFSDVFLTQKRGTQEVCIHAIDIGPGNNHLLGCREVDIADLPDRSFSDVEYLHPFFAEIEWMSSEGVSTGYPDGTYRPSSAVSRAAMSAFMYRLAGQPPVSPGAPSFNDTPADHPFFTEIEWMADEAITTGYSDGGFHPGDTVTRQSMSAFMYRLAGQPPVSPGAPSFNDTPADHPFFTEIEWMADEAITTGYPNGTYRPRSAVSRQAMSAFMHRLAEGPGVGV